VGEILGEITKASESVNGLIGEIAAATREQALGIGQLNTAVAEIDKVTQSNAASAEESASASEELTAQAKQLEETVISLTTLIGGASSKGRAERADRAVVNATSNRARGTEATVGERHEVSATGDLARAA
jgi:methyl-accepting chemotaxis protein